MCIFCAGTEVTTTSRRRVCAYVRVCTCAHVCSLHGNTCTDHSLVHVCVCVYVCGYYTDHSLVYVHECVSLCVLHIGHLLIQIFDGCSFFVFGHQEGASGLAHSAASSSYGVGPGGGSECPPPLPSVCRGILSLLSLRNTRPRA
jgi:hypothetical protein